MSNGKQVKFRECAEEKKDDDDDDDVLMIPAAPSTVASKSQEEHEKKQTVVDNNDDDTNKSSTKLRRPWWNRGGMHITKAGMALNTFVGMYYLFRDTTNLMQTAAAVLYVALVLSAFLLHRMRAVFCGIIAPAYMTSVLACLQLHGSNGKSTSIPFYQIFCIGSIIATAKVAFCMSVCLHRYAAHAAFKCGKVTQLFVSIMGCLANQGGAIWWASQHRKHHKNCDVPGDPHSQLLVGVEYAFSFFLKYTRVDEQFAPFHCDNWYLRILDTWSFAVVSLEFAISYALFGTTGLWLAYYSAWACQTATLWFNISNHPVEDPAECKASDYFKGRASSNHTWYPLWIFLDFVSPMFGLFVGEANHKHHHEHFALAKRDDMDCGYWFFLLPLQKLGLVWDVKLLPEDDINSKSYVASSLIKKVLIGKAKTK